MIFCARRNIVFKLGLLVGLLFATSAFAQKTFDIKNASKYFDINVRIAKCDDRTCRGEAAFSFYKKGGSTPYQVIKLDDTFAYVDLSTESPVDQTLSDDIREIVYVDDYDFDGMDDVAICNGLNGSYGSPSYNVYLSSRAAKKFVYSKAFPALVRISLCSMC